jgi:hypothetical protein
VTTRIIRGAEITAPVPERLKSTLLDHANVVSPEGDFGLRNDDAIWPSYNSSLHQTLLDFCVPSEQEFQGHQWSKGLEFALQAGFKCSAVGLDRALMERETKRIFDATESRGIEAALKTRLDLNTTFTLRTLGVAGEAAPDIALALLEGSAHATYAGTPTIHISAFIASLLGSDKIVWEGGKAYTRLGSKVVIGGGYDVAGQGATSRMYATGEIAIERSDQIDFTLNTVPGDGSTIDPDAVNEVQTITVTGAPTGGTFRLTWNGQQTATIAHNASAATVQTALEALSNIAPGDIAVTGGPGPSTAWVVTFLAPGDVAAITVTSPAFTGGTAPAASVATTTAGANGSRTAIGDNKVLASAERLYRVVLDPISVDHTALVVTGKAW